MSRQLEELAEPLSAEDRFNIALVRLCEEAWRQMMERVGEGVGPFSEGGASDPDEAADIS